MSSDSGNTVWTAREVMQISGAYWKGCAVHAAVQLDIFSRLAEGPKDELVLARELGCDSRAFSMLMTALTAIGFTQRNGDGISAAPGILPLLSRDSPEYLGFLIKHQSNIMPGWAKLATAVRTGKSTADGSASFTENVDDREDFLMGMFTIARLQAENIADALDLSGKKHLLDLGGGPGTYAIYFCQKNPELCATIFDLPTTEPFARKTVARFNLTDRIAFMGGDFSRDPFPRGQDVVWLSQVLHGETPANAAMLIKNAGACLNPGGLICVQEFMLDNDRKGPEQPALFALNMLVQTPGGQVYTQGEITDMLIKSGAEKVYLLNAELPQGCRVLVGEIPDAS